MLSYKNLSNQAFVFIITTLCFVILTSNTEAIPNHLHYFCSNTTAYTPNSTYQTNLNLLLSSLYSSSMNDGTIFSTSTAGKDPPNIVYGLFLCRGDLYVPDCRDCVATATGEIITICPNQKSAVIWYDECMLRYDNSSFFSTVEDQQWFFWINPNNITRTKQARFRKVVGETMDELAKMATTDSPNDQFVKGFATREANFTSLIKLYGLVQCTQDLSNVDCNLCLQTALRYLQQVSNTTEGARVFLPSCNIRFEIYPFYHHLVPPAGGGKREISPTTIIAIAISMSIIVSLLLFVIGRCYIVRKSKKSYYVLTDETDAIEITDVRSLQFDLGTIQVATNNFSNENKIGQGGFGMVYKGTLANGQDIAVKRLSKTSRQGELEFKNEVVLVAKLQHRNLVRLLGFCLEGEEKILVYEYVPNKSLDYFLFDPEKQEQLPWSIRYKIIGGIARGMLYLHEDSRLRIIHRDLKASNILLDDKMNPKVSDFGMARIFGVDQTQGNTNRIVGTYGYMSPEYAMHGHFSVGSDVFSFGVLVLEIICGKRNSCFHPTVHGKDFLSHAWKMWKDGTPLELMDPTLADSHVRNEVMRCIQMGLLCVQEDVDSRPSMAAIVLMLSSYNVSFPLPKQPPFYFRSRIESEAPEGLELDKSRSKSAAMVSVDKASITQRSRSKLPRLGYADPKAGSPHGPPRCAGYGASRGHPSWIIEYAAFKTVSLYTDQEVLAQPQRSRNENRLFKWRFSLKPAVEEDLLGIEIWGVTFKDRVRIIIFESTRIMNELKTLCFDGGPKGKQFGGYGNVGTPRVS
ncbi:hypothetical protein LguiA_033168 [Lonicera macranthoides]